MTIYLPEVPLDVSEFDVISIPLELTYRSEDGERREEFIRVRLENNLQIIE